MSASFDTKAYCIQHQIPCFTFYMDASKRCDTPWKHIGPTNFKQELREYENGFAVITGFTHMVVDLDFETRSTRRDSGGTRGPLRMH
jgi:hypothetical protein